MKISIKNILNKDKEDLKNKSNRKSKSFKINIGNKRYVKNTKKQRKSENVNSITKRTGATNAVRKYGDKIKSKKRFAGYFDNLFRNKNKLSRGYYALLFVMILLGGVSLTLAIKSYKESSLEDYATYGEDDNIAASSSVDNGTSSNSIEEEVNKITGINVSTDTAKVVNKTPVNTTPKVTPLSFSKPIVGDILKMFSDDKVIYSKTLELWKTHDGIDIKANIGDSVKSIEKGRVEKVYDDSFYGKTIVIDHGQGYKSSYSNLDETVKVKEKQNVTKGQIIGKISNTAIGEIKDESHLHFMLLKNNNIIDPTYIFK